MKITRKTIIRTAEKLAAMGCPSSDRGEGHFSSTQETMERFLGRPLLRTERRALWLSRFSCQLQNQSALSRGYFLDWLTVVERLQTPTQTQTPTPTPAPAPTPAVIETNKRR